MKLLKKIVVSALLACVALSATGCGKEEDAICVVGDVEFTPKDMKAYGVMFAQEHGLVSGEDLSAVNEDGVSYEEYYKSELRKDVVETLLIYNEAKENKVSLNKENKKEMKESVDTILDIYGKHWLDENDLERADIERMCEIRALSDQFLREEMENETGMTQTSGARYVRIHQVQFMTVKMKDSGLLDTTDDGEPIGLSASEVQSVKEEAEDFSQRARDEKSITISRKNYDAYMSQIENFYKYDDLEPAMRDAIDTMKKGDISEAVKFKYGYCVFELLESDAKDFSETLYKHEVNEQQNNYREAWIKNLRREMAKEENVFENVEYWKEVRMKDFVRN